MDYNTAAEHGFLLPNGNIAGYRSDSSNVKLDAQRIVNSNNSSSAKANALEAIGNVTGTDVSNYIASIPNTDLNSAKGVLNYANELARLNTEAEQNMAREQMEFQRDSQMQAMAFNAKEAEKNRMFQSAMSNTAHTREVADLLNAGLNPILSANGGASTPSGNAGSVGTLNGAKGTVDTSNMQVLAGVYSMAKQIEMQEKTLALEDKKIEAQKYMNEVTNATTKYAADKGAYASMASAGTYASANRYASDNSLFASQYSADKAYENAHYAADKSYNAGIDSAFIHGASAALPNSQAGALAAYTATKLGNAIVNTAKENKSKNNVFSTGNTKSKHR